MKQLRRFRPVILIAIALVLGTLVSQQPDTTIPLPKAITDLQSEAAETITTVTESLSDAQPGMYKVVDVVDGDTIRVEQGSQKATVRLLGIDTPETHDPRKPVQCFGEAASAHAKSILNGENVRLEPDPTNSDKDKYGRLLRYVYLADGTVVNAALVRDGYAFAYTVFPFTKLDEFRTLEREARENNRGLWAGCNVDESKQIKQTVNDK
jgi:micrococcal nuclease